MINNWDVPEEVAEQRLRNHARWGDRSVEGNAPEDEGRWLALIVEEVGEISRALLDGDRAALRREAVDAMAVCWMLIDAIDGNPS